jgi:hypothetical protein
MVPRSGRNLEGVNVDTINEIELEHLNEEALHFPALLTLQSHWRFSN